MLQVVSVMLSLKCGRFRRNLVATLLPAYKILLHICLASAWISHPTLNTNTPMWDTSSFRLLSSIFPDKSTSTIPNPPFLHALRCPNVAYRSILPRRRPSHPKVQQRWPQRPPPKFQYPSAAIFGGDGMYKETAVGPSSLAASATTLVRFLNSHGISSLLEGTVVRGRTHPVAVMARTAELGSLLQAARMGLTMQ